MTARSAAAPVEPLPRFGPRVVLRRLSLADLERFQAYRGEPEVGKYQGWSAMSAAEAAAFLATMGKAAFCPDGEWLQIAIAERSAGHLIGDIGIRVRGGQERCAEIGITLAPAAQGQGLAEEAVNELLGMLFESANVSRVIAITDARNLPSMRLLERVGMRLDETVDTVFRGEPCVEHTYVIGRADRRPGPRFAMSR